MAKLAGGRGWRRAVCLSAALAAALSAAGAAAAGPGNGGIAAAGDSAAKAAAMAQNAGAQSAKMRPAETMLIAPVLKLAPAGQNIALPGAAAPQLAAPRVALTLDLCMGQVDRRILNVLEQHNIPATLFMTGRFVRNKGNSQVLAEIRRRPDLFEIGNHGADHVPPIIGRPTIYGLKTAGSLAAVCAEAAGGQKALMAAGFGPQMGGQYWYRGAAALYSPAALRLLTQAGYSIAGFSLNGDEGASVAAERAYRLIAAAKNGDVIIAHMNQPKRPAGVGVARAILALKERGYHFVRLSEAAETETVRQQLPAGADIAGLIERSPGAGAPAADCAALPGSKPPAE